MNPLLLAPTAETPSVDFDAKSGQLKLEGRSWPEDVTRFYTPLIEWFTAYISSAKPETDFYLTLEYFNSASSKMIYRLFMKLIEVVKNSSKVTIHWCYQLNDEEMLEVGKEYQAAIHCSSDLFEFKFVGIDDYPQQVK
jgi:hypothetical protein